MNTLFSLQENHPLEPFLPPKARLLMMGSFPPPAARWSMDFYYPNFQNDMWRIVGYVFFNDKTYFIRGKTFDKEGIKAFCTAKGIALYDTAHKIIREKGNASDKYLHVVEPVDLAGMLLRIPACTHVAVTGQKAAEILMQVLAGPGFEQTPDLPKVGESVPFHYGARTLKLYRMPSTSRAYPMSLEKKAAFYEQLFTEIV
ncbi:MAG: uracil-DNA glycosylase family protein [Bacteroidales bacterium]|jgi:G:T/U-mismatch repair DNA glycosylase